MRNYGRWYGNPNGEPEDQSRCIAEAGNGSLCRQCSRKRGHGDGGQFCAQHAKAKAAGKIVQIPDDEPPGTPNPTRKKLLEAGVKNLKEFGYPTVDAENILTDYVFWGFFKSMLKETAEDKRLPRGFRDEAQKLLDETPQPTMA